MLRIRQLRESRGWSRLEASRRARIAPTTYGQIETGRYIPYERELNRIAKAYGFTGDPVGLLEQASEPPEDGDVK